MVGGREDEEEEEGERVAVLSEIRTREANDESRGEWRGRDGQEKERGRAKFEYIFGAGVPVVSASASVFVLAPLKVGQLATPFRVCHTYTYVLTYSTLWAM